MRFILFSLSIGTLCVLASSAINDESINSIDVDPRFDARVSDLVARNVLELAHDIGTRLLQRDNKPNQVISPLSIFGVLSQLLLGSNGETNYELMNLLKFDGDPYLSQNPWKIHQEFSLMLDDINLESPNARHKRPSEHWQTHRESEGDPMIGRPNRNRDPRSFQKILVANGLFVQNGFSIKPDYRNVVESMYQSKVQNLDFARQSLQAMQFLNRWVNEKTEGKIKTLFNEPIDPATKVIIATSLYFKALWERTFLAGVTRPSQFYPDGTENPSITVDMMANAGVFPFYDSKEYDCRILGLPYRRNLTTMFIIVPNNSSSGRLKQLQESLTADKIQNMINRMEWKSAIILFPKLHLENEVDLLQILSDLGVKSLSQYGKSDLSLISSSSETAMPATNGFQSQFVPLYHRPTTDEDSNDRFIFSSRFGANESDEASNNFNRRPKRSLVTYKVSSQFHSAREPLRLKDLVIGKRITKSYLRKKNVSRGRRDLTLTANPDPLESLKNLDTLRRLHLQGYFTQSNPGLYVDQFIHKIDLTVDEQGTEGAAVTASSITRSGTKVMFRVDTPFMFLIRHDDTKLPLFYGTVSRPTS